MIQERMQARNIESKHRSKCKADQAKSAELGSK
jgi:hypothetical protein